MNNYYATYGMNNYGRPYIPPPQPIPPQPQQMENQNGNLSNCNFIKVPGPKSVEEFVVDGGYTIYFLDNNKPIMYVKKASEFGPTTTKYYTIHEIDINELNKIMNENQFQSPAESKQNISDISREEFDAMKNELEEYKRTINNLVSTMNSNCVDIQNLQDMVSKSNMRDRRDIYESTSRRPKSKSTGKPADEQYAKYGSEQSESGGHDETNGS